MSHSTANVNILIVGGTGNTGLPATKTLSKIAADSSSSFPMNILVVSRDIKSSAAEEIRALGNVQLIEKNWLEIDDNWLQQHRIDRLYIASHNYPTHFTDESLFLLSCKLAGVKYVVRLSTLPHYLRADTPVYYGRNHWAIETMLQQKEFSTLNWTNLRANYWSTAYLSSLAPLKDKTISRVRVPFDEINAVAMVDPAEVGMVAAKLLAIPNPAQHYGKTYNLSGAEDANGKKVKEIAETLLKRKLEFEYRSVAWLQELFTAMNYPKYVMNSLTVSFTQYFMTGIARLENTKTSEELPALLGAKQKTLQQMVAESLQ